MDEGEPGRGWTDYARWALILAILLFGLVGSAAGQFETCAEEATAQGVVEVCGPLGLSDLPVVAALALVLFLAMPDLAEASIGGVFSIKKRLNRAEAQVDQQARQIDGLRLSIDSRMSAAAAAENNVIIVSEHSLDQLPVTIQRKARGEPPAPEVREPARSDEYAEQAVRLIRNWERLAEMLLLPPYATPRRPGRRDLLSDGGDALSLSVEDEKIYQFSTVFSDEIQLVRAARNAVAHDRGLSPEAVIDAADAAEELIRVFQAGNGAPP